MAEIKNNFTGSKMNKDLDSRLVPDNEYRNALNLQINKSENSDVGTLQNILGNSFIVDYGDLIGAPMQCIGTYADESNNDIYIFLTNNTLPGYVETAKNAIYVYNTLNLSDTELCVGEYLNFSTLNPILGVNLIENLLFWTDNRNQPRRINTDKAKDTAGYYTTEDQISVAKLTPVNPINLFRMTALNKNVALSATANVVTISGSAPWTATITPGTPIAANKLEIGSTVTATPNGSTFTFGTVTSIALSGAYISSFVISNAFSFTGGNITNLLNTTANQFETSMYDVTSPYLNVGPFGVATNNPYYNAEYPGDATFLGNKFVRFSYRYRFEDGEYSLMAPFTQIEFIPKQDGYFTYKGGTPPADDEANTYRSTVVDFMENKVNNILLQVPLPTAAHDVYPICKISTIEILYKESDSLKVNVIDVIQVEGSTDTFWQYDDIIYSYNYQSKKPFKTLPEKDLIRVYDKTPVKALGQEIAGNRVIYSNYQDKFYYPKTMDFNAGFSTKSTFNPISIYSGSDGLMKGTSIKEYPNHSLKQNRNYQIGIVLCDKFGRQSGVILSSTATTQSSLGTGSLYVPYIKDGSNIIPSQWPGYSLKIGFNKKIDVNPNISLGWPGVYNGDPLSPGYNPLGWYSYKIVVKQTEQEYYNVYLPGVMAAYPSNTTLEIGRTSHTVLINDNINKIPRDLKEIGPAQVQFSSSAILFPRVNNTSTTSFNEQSYPGEESYIVSTIATTNSLFYENGTATNTPLAGVNNFYNYISNPLIAKISTTSQVGIIAQATPATLQRLAILETAPVESKLDIYWETSTVGLISELNDAIDSGAPPDQIVLLDTWSFALQEDLSAVTNVTGEFRFMSADNVPKNPSNITLVVADLNNNIVSSKFEIYLFDTPTKKYKIRTTAGSYFFYSDNPLLNSFTFTITTTQNGYSPATFTNYGSITNIVPKFTIPSTSSLSITRDIGETNIYTFEARNGAAVGNGVTNYTNGLVIGKDGSGSQLFTLSAASSGVAVLTAPSNLTGTYDFDITVTDAGELEQILPITVTILPVNNVTFSTQRSFYEEGQGGDSAALDGTVTVTGDPATFYVRVSNGNFADSYISFDIIGTPQPPIYVSRSEQGISESTTVVVLESGTWTYRILYGIEVDSPDGFGSADVLYTQ
jgi:hypothetical protein